MTHYHERPGTGSHLGADSIAVGGIEIYLYAEPAKPVKLMTGNTNAGESPDGDLRPNIARLEDISFHTAAVVFKIAFVV